MTPNQWLSLQTQQQSVSRVQERDILFFSEAFYTTWSLFATTAIAGAFQTECRFKGFPHWLNFSEQEATTI